MKDDILHTKIPKGPGGQFNLGGGFTDVVMGYSKNQKPAKDFRLWVHHTRRKIFDNKRDARPVCQQLRTLCPRNAD